MKKEKEFKFSQYQIDVLDKFRGSLSGALLMGVGTGKTSTLIGLLKERIEQHGIKRILIISPSTVVPNWEKEFKKVWPECPLPIHTSFGNKSSRKKDLMQFVKDYKESGGIISTNYETATSSLGPILEEFSPEMLGFDEAHNLKNPKSKRAKFFLNLRKKAHGCFILTGTIVANTIADAFTSFHIMDLGKTFGTNFWVFQRKYMFDANEHWAGQPGYYPKWQVRKNMLPEFKEKISEVSVSVTSKDVLDLPPLVRENRYVTMTKEQEKAYKELKKLLITELRGEFITVENALTKVLRLNQICAGHIGSGEDTIVFEQTEKDKVLKEIIEEIKESGEKAIIWTVFRADVDRVVKILKECGVHNICMITGSQNGHEKQDAEYAFKNDSRFPFIICNLQSANAGLNLQEAKYSVNYSRDFSFIRAHQSEARNYRRGSEVHESIVQYNLITKDSIEEEIMDIIEKKQELSDYVLDNIVELKELEKEMKNNILKEFLGEY